MKNTKSSLLLLIFIAVLSIFSSCSRDDDNPASQSRNIEYEITGSYSGKLACTYADEGGNGQTIDVNSLPWSKSVTIESDVPAIALAAGGGVDNPGEIGETITLKIYRNGVVVEESTATATDNGFIELGIAYSLDL